MSCHSKWCSTLQAISQLAVACVLIYAGWVVNSHMESWSASFQRGSEDLHSIRQNMNTIAYSMESINQDMDDMKTQVEVGIDVSKKMEVHVNNLNTTIGSMNSQLNAMNRNVYMMNGAVSGIDDKFSPQGMMRSFMPF